MPLSELASLEALNIRDPALKVTRRFISADLDSRLPGAYSSLIDMRGGNDRDWLVSYKHLR